MSPFGFQVHIDPDLPPGEARLVDSRNHKTLARITNIGESMTPQIDLSPQPASPLVRRVFVVVEDYKARPESYDLPAEDWPDGVVPDTLEDRVLSIDGEGTFDQASEALINTLEADEDVAGLRMFIAVGPNAHDPVDPLMERIRVLVDLAKRRGTEVLRYPRADTQPDPCVVVKREEAVTGSPHPRVTWEVWSGTIPDPKNLEHPDTQAVLMAECSAEHIADTVAQGLNAAHWAQALEQMMGMPPGLVLDDLIRKGRETEWRARFEGETDDEG